MNQSIVNQSISMFLIDIDGMIPRIGVVNRLPFAVFIHISISDIRSSCRLPY